MDLLMRRREMMLAAAGAPVIPTVTLPVGGTPWTDFYSIVSPNVVYVGKLSSGNWSTTYFNLRQRNRSDPAYNPSTTWFTIPANSTVQIVLRNIARKSGQNTAIKIGMNARAPSSTSNIINIAVTTLQYADMPKTLTATKTITTETNVGNVFITTTGTTGINFTCEVEFWINDQRVF